mmetsp:Transcript_48854/g.163030  ORF Transcript_48854/g.163030 Transcript_48854/m.163030 type:complete len:464 (-) Transcript_48854:1009-2400(-)
MAPSLPKPSRDFVLLRRAEYCERQRASAPAAVSAATMARDKAPVNDGSGSLSFLADCCVPGLLALPCCIGQLVSSQTCNCMPLRPVASVMNRITTYSLQNPSCCCGVAAFTGKWVAYAHGMMFDGVADKRRPYLERAQLFGETFTICGKLVIAGPPALHQELVVGPQNRGPYLGVNNLVLKSLPLDAAGLAIMPLTLPSGDCPMNRGHHRAFRNAMAKYVTNEAALKRGVESDPVVRRALDGLLASGIAPGKCTAKQFTTAILHFLTRTIHYGLLGLDLGDEDCELFTTVYQTQALLLPNILYYSASGPSALCEPCCMPFSSSLFKPKRLERLREIYREALSVQGYRQDPSDPTAPSLSEFADQLVGLIFLAAVNGIKTALFGLLGTKLGLDLLGWGETDVPQVARRPRRGRDEIEPRSRRDRAEMEARSRFGSRRRAFRETSRFRSTTTRSCGCACCRPPRS